jgi:hypothetical protein
MNASIQFASLLSRPVSSGSLSVRSIGSQDLEAFAEALESGERAAASRVAMLSDAVAVFGGFGGAPEWLTDDLAAARRLLASYR